MFLSWTFIALTIVGGVSWALPRAGDRVSWIDMEEIAIDNWYPKSTGEWGPFELCPSNEFAFAVDVKYQAPGNIDETALNGVKLYCKSKDGPMSTHVTSTVGVHGRWTDDMMQCPSGGFFTGMKLNVLAYQGPFTDDVALENLQLLCDDGNVVEPLPFAGSLASLSRVQDFKTGNWSEMVECGIGKAVCGIQMKHEGLTVGDEVANVDMKLMCCPRVMPPQVLALASKTLN